MKSDKHRDITEQMAEKLRKHSLPYKEGAWERFQEFEASKSKKIVLWPFFTAAAAMLILAFTLFVNLNDSAPIENASQIAQRNLPIENEIMQVVPPISEPEEGGMVIETPSVAPVLASRQSQAVSINNAVITDTYTSEGSVSTMQSSDIEPSKAKEASPELPLVQKEERKQSSFNDGFYKQDFNQEIAEVKNNKSNNFSKWNFSIELSPNIKDRNVNFGGGVAVAYNLTEKVSVSSGISYVALDAHRGPNQVDRPADAPSIGVTTYNYSKSLNAVNTSLRGLDIPINLKVDINSNMYASAGVSVFSVLDETRYNGYEERVAEIAYKTEKSGAASPEPMVRTIYSTEVSEETPYEDKNFTGFFNLSVGYRLPFLKNLNLAVEPYLKIPVGSLTQEDMNLSNGGLKIITSF